MATHRVHFRKEDVTVRVATGTNLRQACLDAGIDPYPALGGLLSCRGKGFCGTCAVEVDEAEVLAPASKREQKYLKKLKHDTQLVRLSCQAHVQGDVIVTTNPDMKPAWRSHGFYSGRPMRSWQVANLDLDPVDGPEVGSGPSGSGTKN